MKINLKENFPEDNLTFSTNIITKMLKILKFSYRKANIYNININSN